MERAFEYDGLGALFPVDESSLWVLHKFEVEGKWSEVQAAVGGPGGWSVL